LRRQVEELTYLPPPLEPPRKEHRPPHAPTPTPRYERFVLVGREPAQRNLLPERLLYHLPLPHARNNSQHHDQQQPAPIADEYPQARSQYQSVICLVVRLREYA